LWSKCANLSDHWSGLNVTKAINLLAKQPNPFYKIFFTEKRLRHRNSRLNNRNMQMSNIGKFLEVARVLSSPQLLQELYEAIQQAQQHPEQGNHWFRP
jgi:fructosamine-3-kinase